MLSEMLIVFSSLLLAADAELRVWLDKKGETIAEATLDRLEGNSVHLKTAEGETLVVSLDVLSDADRAFVAASTPRAWTFKDGTSLEAVLVKKSGVQIHLKDKAEGKTHIVAFDSLTPADQRFAEEHLRSMRLANPRFIRVLRNGRGEPEVLETSIARYVSVADNKITVDLVSAVHVADGDYFEKLDEELKNYDAVLYELVAPKDDAVPKPGQPSRNTVGSIQRIIRDLLQFEYQLDGIDYSQPNFIHADMTPEELAAEMSKRGETPLNLFLKMFERIQKAPTADSKPLGEDDLVLALFRFAKNPSLTLRRAMAGQMEDVEGFVAVFEGETGSSILSGRNDAALKVLQEQIDGGKRNIAILYGAGHMPDLEKKLQQDFGLKFEGERWIPAWNMSDDATFGDKPADE
jgi:hypothetical protein